MTTAPSSRPDPLRSPLARLAELALVVPIEVSERVIEAVPVVVDKVPPAAERVRRELVLARFLGKLAVDQGLRELRSRLLPTDAPADAAVERSTTEDADDAEVSSPPVRSVDEATTPVEQPPTSDALALSDYDHLSSAQIVSKLAGLDESELDAIEAYERAGRHRRTILGKIEQLRAAEGAP
jgi:hypothetical protein